MAKMDYYTHTVLFTFLDFVENASPCDCSSQAVFERREIFICSKSKMFRFLQRNLWLLLQGSFYWAVDWRKAVGAVICFPACIKNIIFYFLPLLSAPSGFIRPDSCMEKGMGGKEREKRETYAKLFIKFF